MSTYQRHPSTSWIKCDNGNFVYARACGVIATVFLHPKYKNWRCVINLDFGAHHVQEVFESAESAMLHAEDLIPFRHSLMPTPTSVAAVGSWGQHAKPFGGAPSYGRHYGRLSVSVRRAKSGQWYYVPYEGATSYKLCGWFPTAAEAQAAADQKYLNHHQRR